MFILALFVTATLWSIPGWCHQAQKPLIWPVPSAWQNPAANDSPIVSIILRADPWGQLMTFVKADSVFSGISTFARLPYHPCLTDHSFSFDIAFVGESQSIVLRAFLGA